jgi:hypothetical protein
MQVPHVKATQSDIDAQTDKRFGYCLENPIKARNLMMSCVYVEMLQPADGGEFTRDRVLVYEMPNGHYVDVYKLTNSRSDEALTIYVDGYCDTNSKEVPEGCILKARAAPESLRKVSPSSTGCMIPLVTLLTTMVLSLAVVMKVV